MVSKASDDFPEPDKPVKTINLSRGRSTEIFRRLCSRAPRITSMSDIAVQATSERTFGREPAGTGWLLPADPLIAPRLEHEAVQWHPTPTADRPAGNSRWTAVKQDEVDLGHTFGMGHRQGARRVGDTRRRQPATVPVERSSLPAQAPQGRDDHHAGRHPIDDADGPGIVARPLNVPDRTQAGHDQREDRERNGGGPAPPAGSLDGHSTHNGEHGTGLSHAPI